MKIFCKNCNDYKDNIIEDKDRKKVIFGEVKCPHCSILLEYHGD